MAIKISGSTIIDDSRVLINTGNVGVGTTNPDTAVDPGNTNIVHAGIVTANTFYGDGSNLTNLPNAGIATSASFLQQDADGNILAGDSTTGGGYNPATGTACFNIFMGCNAGNSITEGDYNFFAGQCAGFCNTTGNFNNFLGRNAGKCNTTGCNNNFIGAYSGCSNTTGSCNNFFGSFAGLANTTGGNNNFFGSFAGLANTTGCCNNMIGNGAGRCATVTGIHNTFLGTYAGKCASGSGACNNFIGFCAGYNNTTGFSNNFFGACAGSANTTGSNNNFFGFNAGFCNTTGSSNNFIGCCAGYDNTTGGCNNFLGHNAGENSTIGSTNNYIGMFAGRCGTQASRNNFIGQYAGLSNVTGCCNNMIGRGAGQCAATTGEHNTFLGTYAGKCASGSGACNNFIGFCAGYNNTTGFSNNFFGLSAGCSNTTGNFNNFFGCNAGYSNTTGSCNNMIGLGAGQCATVTGCNNTLLGTYAGKCASGSGGFNNIIGYFAGCQNTGGFNNFIGYQAGQCNTTGIYNNYIGFNAGKCNTGSHNFFVGNSAGSDQTSGDSNIVIGCGVQLPNLTGSTQLAIGDGSNRWISGDSSFNIGFGTYTPSGAADPNNTQIVNAGIVTANFYYGDGSNLTNLPNSGIATDSERLDGLDSTQFLRSDVADTTTGDITISKTSPKLILNDTNTTTGSYPAIQFDTDNNQGVLLEHNEFDTELPTNGYGLILKESPNNSQFPSTGTLTFIVLGEIYTGSATTSSTSRVLTTADEGPGNGLDADTLDGIEGANFLRSNADDTASGQITFSDSIVPSVGNNTSSGINWPPNPGGGSGDQASIRYYITSGENTTLEISNNNDGSDIINLVAGSVNVGGNRILTTADEGSGNGLDADTLDGQEGSYYLNTATSFSGDVTGTYNSISVTNDSHTHDTRYFTETESDARFLRKDAADTAVGPIGVNTTTVVGTANSEGAIQAVGNIALTDGAILTDQNIDNNIYIPSGKNGLLIGPSTVGAGVTIDIAPGSTLVVV